MRPWIVELAIALIVLASVAPMAPGQAAGANPPVDPFLQLAAKKPQPPQPGGSIVRVVRPDGAPAADAVVVYTPSGGLVATRAAEALAVLAWPGDRPRQLATMACDGIRLRVDALGATRVPIRGTVLAFAGDLVAAKWVSHEGEVPIVMSLAPVHECMVEVVDTDGRPVEGVPVHLGGGHPDPLFSHRALADRTRAIRTLLQGATTGVVTLEIGSRQPIQAPLPPHVGRVRLQLPPTTSFTAHLRGELPPGTEVAWLLRVGARGCEYVGAAADERTAHWPLVEVGVDVVVTARLALADWGSESILATRGANVTANAPPLELDREPAVPIVAVPLGTVEGDPASHRAVKVLVTHRGIGRAVILRSNREGWIELPLPPTVADGQPVSVQLELLDVFSEGVPEARARFEVRFDAVHRLEHPGIRCTAVPPLVAGTIVTPEGRPVAAVELGLGGRRQHSDAEGRFVFRGERAHQDPLAIQLERAWCQIAGDPWHCRLQAGVTQARIVVQRSARIRFGSDLVAPDLSPIRYRLESTERERQVVDIDIDWRSEVLIVPPGTWQLVVHAGGDELLRLPDVIGESGIETHDIRFLSFDWRAFARLVTIRFLDARGRPSDACTVSVGNRDLRPHRGLVRLLLPLAGSDVEVKEFDGTRHRLPRLTADRVVELHDS